MKQHWQFGIKKHYHVDCYRAEYGKQRFIMQSMLHEYLEWDPNTTTTLELEVNDHFAKML